MATLDVYRLGRVAYAEAHALQERLVAERQENAIGDVLLLVEHDPVLTLGRGTREGHVLWSAEQLTAHGIAVHDVGRGGDVTYHGPGQLVAYPIMALAAGRRDVRQYVRDLEETMIDVCSGFDLAATRVPEFIGAWVGNDKIGAIGVRISRWVTMHGFALNVYTNLSHFEAIVPCGIPGRGVTSLERQLGRRVPMAEVEDRTIECFCERFAAAPMVHEGPPSP